MSRVIFDLPKVRKMIIYFKLLKVSQMIIYFKLLKVSKMISFKIYVSPVMREAKTLKFQQQVNLIKTVPLGPLPQEIVMLLPYNNMTLTNLLISSYSRTVVIKFGQLKQLLNRSS